MTPVLFCCQALRKWSTLGHVSSQPLAKVLGENCARIRRAIGITQDDLALHARAVGLRWNAAKVGNFEKGRSAPTFATVLAVTVALQNALRGAAKRRHETSDWGVTLADLVAGDGFVALNDNFGVSAALLAEVCRGAVFEPRSVDVQFTFRQHSAREVHELVGTMQRSGLTEQRLAHRLGIGPDRLAAVSSRLWKRTFSEERDRRAGAGANQQKKGRVSRELRAELEKAIADGND